jgi:hypothetical protein
MDPVCHTECHTAYFFPPLGLTVCEFGSLNLKKVESMNDFRNLTPRSESVHFIPKLDISHETSQAGLRGGRSFIAPNIISGFHISSFAVISRNSELSDIRTKGLRYALGD